MRAVQAEQYFLDECGRTEEAAALDDLLDRLETQYAEADEDETVDDVIIDHDMEHFTDDELDMLGISEDDAQFAPDDYDDMYGGSEDGYGDESDDAESDDSDDSADAEAGRTPMPKTRRPLTARWPTRRSCRPRRPKKAPNPSPTPPTRTPMTPARPLMKPRTRNPPKPTMRRRPKTPPNRLRKRRTSDAHERHAQIHRPSHISDVPAGVARSGRASSTGARTRWNTPPIHQGGAACGNAGGIHHQQLLPFPARRRRAASRLRP